MQTRFTPELSVELPVVQDAQITPDGDLIAFVVADFTREGRDGPKLPRASIHAVPAVGGASFQLTKSGRSDTMPRWSPDGRWLAFLSDREEDGQRQVYVLPRDGGEARKLTSVRGDIPSPRSLSPMQWSADSSTIAFLKVDARSEEERRRAEAGDDAVLFEADPKFMRLWTVNVETGNTRCVSPDGLQVWEFALSPDGVRAAAVVSDLPYEWAWYVNRLTVFELGGGTATTLYRSRRQVAKPAWSPDGGNIVFLTSNWSDRGVDSGDVMLIPASGGEAGNLTSGHGVSDGAAVFHPDGDRLLTATNVHAGSGIGVVDVGTGGRTWLWQDRKLLSGFSRSENDVFAAVIEDTENLPEVFVGPMVDGRIRWQRRTSINAAYADLEIGETREMFWSGRDGLRIQGLLQLPDGYPDRHGEGRPIPMVTLVHGGPTSGVRFGYHDGHRWAKLIADAGIGVFMPNYRGSTGWGVEFAEMNIGDMGGEDFRDMMAGLDQLVKAGIADPDRLGICGWSYGGFTTAWAVTQTDRFKAAVMGAGIADWRSFHGRSYLHTWDRIHYGGSDPYEPDSAHARFSPINHVKNVRTPTLILHGEQDWDVPVEQSYQFHRALRDLGVETELVVYPREPHAVRERAHALDIARRVQTWFRTRLTE